MMNPQESTINFKKYLKKLLAVIQGEASFVLFDTRIIDKKRIDDVMCCIEGSWPEDYIKYTDKFGIIKVKSSKYYEQLILAIRNRFFFSTSCYSVRYNDALQAIAMLMKSIDSDMGYIYSDQSGMF